MSTPPLPGVSEQPAEIFCGSCGRFVGALTRCPHCGAHVKARLSVRAFRIAAVFLATVGLALLYLMAVKRQIPTVHVADISPTMNFAYIRVSGTAVGDARVFRDAGHVRTVRFMVDDGTGEISVTAFAAKGQALADRGLVPHGGDRVEVTGSLNVSADRAALILQSADQMTLTRAATPTVALADISAALKGKSVMIAGRIVDVRPPNPGSRQPWTVKVDDGSAAVEIVFWSDVYTGLADAAQLKPGSSLRARVSVGMYHKQLQVKVESAGDLEWTAAAPAQPTAVEGPA